MKSVDIDKHIENCTLCMSRTFCQELHSLVNYRVQEIHGDLLAAAGEVKVRRFFVPHDPISMLEIEKRGQKQLYTQEEAGAIELGINRLLHSDDEDCG